MSEHSSAKSAAGCKGSRECPICRSLFHGYNKTCSRQCGRRLGSKTNTKTVDDVHCVVCKTKISRKPGERPSKFVKRKSCSRLCTKKLLSGGRPEDRECIRCGARMAFEDQPQSSDRRYNFLRRKTCIGKCRRTVVLLGMSVTIEDLSEVTGMNVQLLEGRIRRLGVEGAIAPKTHRCSKCGTGGHNSISCRR